MKMTKGKPKDKLTSTQKKGGVKNVGKGAHLDAKMPGMKNMPPK